MSQPLTKIIVDGVEHEAPLGGKLIDFLHGIGKEVPHFCYHPGLSVEASCRQCQVESKGKSSKPGLIVSCREKIVEGMDILTDSPASREARRAVMEFLLLNHPLDCPICDKAGECLLQDTAYATGQGEGRSHEKRRELPKRKSLGDRILLDNERCILCTRCVRFFEEVTKEPQLTVTRRGDRSVLSTFMDEPLRGNYQGNIVDLCPVGALTLKKFRFESRVWFLHETKTICGLCSRGCNTVVETRDHQVYRIRPRHNPEVNGYWMCDEGRLEFDVFNRTDRLLEPHSLDAGGHLAPVAADDAIEQAARLLATGDGPVLALLSPWATNEEGTAFATAFAPLAASRKVSFGFLQPEPTGDADDLLHTDEPAPNCRGLAETAQLRPIPIDGLTDAFSRASAVFLSGFGLADLVPDPVKVALRACPAVIYHGHLLAGFTFARVVLPAATPLEKSGYWVNIDGRPQYVRPALRRPATVPEDAGLLRALGAAIGALREMPA